MEDIGDIVNLCSGKFATQADEENGSLNLNADSRTLHTNEVRTRTPEVESQDTVILTGM